jgi:23S rRNA (uracil1939-C5)-methyltransferase
MRQTTCSRRLTNKEIAREPAPALRAGAEVELSFTDLLANGQAVGRASGLVVFCFGPLPQERARVRITSVKPKYATATMLRLIAGSPHRATPFCPVFGSCGGCQVQHLNYPAQLAWKTDVVRSALQRIGGFTDLEVRNTVGMANPRAYRNKMSLVVDHTLQTPTIGFYQQRSHDIVPIEDCPIVTPQLNTFIHVFNHARTTQETAPIMQVARHIVSRSARATGEAVVTVTTPQLSPEVERGAPALVKSLPGAVGLTNSYQLGSQNAIMGRRHRVVEGSSEIEESIDGVRYRVSAASFFQVNVEIVGRIFAFMKTALEHPRRVVDLYCGAGTFSLFFAKNGCQVYGVEENPQAILEAEGNARLNGLEEWVRFRADRVEDAARSPEAHEAMRNADIVFLDPPRKGSDEVTLGAVAQSKVPFIWYLSCDPATLARDLKFLAANGYRLGIVQPFDMFPQTGHVETLVTLYHEAKADEEVVHDAFLNVPYPTWPENDEYAANEPEYPDFVIRED